MGIKSKQPADSARRCLSIYQRWESPPRLPNQFRPVMQSAHFPFSLSLFCLFVHRSLPAQPSADPERTGRVPRAQRKGLRSRDKHIPDPGNLHYPSIGYEVPVSAIAYPALLAAMELESLFLVPLPVRHEREQRHQAKTGLVKPHQSKVTWIPRSVLFVGLSLKITPVFRLNVVFRSTTSC